MSKHKSLSDFAEQCYAAIDGKLCIVTRGEKGWKRAPIDAENSVANHDLAALKNRELGVTPEQARLLVTGAVIGWDAWMTPKASATVAGEIFEVELYCKNQSGVSTSLKLPATPFELADAFDKARITDGATPYQIEMLGCTPEYLYEAIDETANIYELNHLAQRISNMSEWEQNCFEGLVLMEKAKRGDTPIPLERLINFTHSLESCQIAHCISNDAELGTFYVDNGMSDIPDNLPEVMYALLDYESIGRKARTGEGGVFTEKGYVVNSEPIAEVYQSGGAVPQKKPNHTIELEVCKGFFNDPSYDNNHAEFPLLPADDGIIDRVLGQLGASSVEECSFRAVDCIVPKLTELISDTLYETEGDCYGAVNELAKQLKRLDDTGKLTTYRAMIEVAPDDLTLEDAIDLSRQAADFSVMREAVYAADYAETELSKHGIPLLEELLKGANLNRYGENLMERDMAVRTDYGILLAHDGMTVEQCLGRAAPSQNMEMR